MVKKWLHLMQMSMQFSDSQAKMKEDIQYGIDQGADVIGFTEARADKARNAIRDKARANGFRPWAPPRGSTALMVRTGGDSQARLMDTGNRRVHGATNNYAPRFITWVKFKWYGVTMFVHEAHWPNDIRGDDAQVDIRRAHHEKMTRTMCAMVRKHGTGNRASFFMGDVNIDERRDNDSNNRNWPNYIFSQHGLETIWDEFDVVPRPTYSSSVLDIIGSYKHDKRVKGVRYKVHDYLNSDHRPVSAWYSVEVDQRFMSPSNPNSPDFVSEGNVSWKDYRGSEVYPLPYAVDDSDDSPYTR